jgi:osmotically inducible protein OsmC
MPTRESSAVWNGSISRGSGTMKLGSGAWEGGYDVPSRFEDGEGTNPEELIAAAHAGCYSMALSSGLSQAGFDVESIDTTAAVTVVKDGDGFTITTIHLTTTGTVADIDADTFAEHAETAKANCPVSRALAAPEITLDATLG